MSIQKQPVHKFFDKDFFDPIGNSMPMGFDFL